ncbi:SIR2 family histone deacetylase [Geopyxis carbonaria]|nr:SIR2 family histone deacetylase [Geopyxis carbonaria]
MGLSRDCSVAPPFSDDGSQVAAIGEILGDIDGEASEDHWETDSLLEDSLDELRTEDFGEDTGADVCTPDEVKELRALLKRLGVVKFIHEVINERGMTRRKCLTAFKFKEPNWTIGTEDSNLTQFLQVVLRSEINRRTRIPGINSVEHVVKLLLEAENIIVLTGAGISTSLGIPDFRSKDKGLYARLTDLGLNDPQEVFDIDVFTDDPTIFYSIAKDILPDSKRFSPTHAFIKLLQTKNKLLTQYTQNIDNLEISAGIKPEKLIQCHGSFATASCVKCKYKVPGETIYPELKRCMVARCERCLGELAANNVTGKKRKRRRSKSSDQSKKKRYSEDSSAEEEEMNFREAGIMKPDITFFGEQLPDTFHSRLVGHDKAKVDLLVCIGSSLKVAPVSEIIGFLPPTVPQIYISREKVNHLEFDVELLGSCDEVVVELCRRASWDLKHEMIPKPRPEMKVDRIIDENDKDANRFSFTIKDNNKKKSVVTTEELANSTMNGDEKLKRVTNGVA